MEGDVYSPIALFSHALQVTPIMALACLSTMRQSSYIAEYVALDQLALLLRQPPLAHGPLKPSLSLGVCRINLTVPLTSTGQDAAKKLRGRGGRCGAREDGLCQ